MTPTRVPALAAVQRLRSVLDALAEALASANLDQLQASEALLAGALADVQQAQVDRSEPQTVAEELGRARAALERCRRVGGALADIGAAVLASRGIYTDYDRAGSTSTAARGAAPRARLSCRV